MWGIEGRRRGAGCRLQEGDTRAKMAARTQRSMSVADTARGYSIYKRRIPFPTAAWNITIIGSYQFRGIRKRCLILTSSRLCSPSACVLLKDVCMYSRTLMKTNISSFIFYLDTFQTRCS